MLYETSAICGYIDEKFDGPGLTPVDRRNRALMEQWISVINSYVDKSFIRNFVLEYNFPRGENGNINRNAIELEIPNIRRILRTLNREYGRSDYLVGDALTLADLFLAPILFYFVRTPEGPELLEKAPNVRRGLEKVSARSSYVRALCEKTMA